MKALKIVAAAGLLACGQGKTATAPPQAPRGLPPWDGRRAFTDSIRFDGLSRDFIVHLPVGYDHVARKPVVLVFHGSGGNAQGMQTHSGLDAFGDAEGFGIVYANAVRAWAEDCAGCSAGDALGIDDLGFVRALVDTLTANWAIDPARVFATGFSQGAMFIQRLACEPGTPVAGIASVGATLRAATAAVCGQGAFRPRPLSVLLMHGTLDNTLPAGGRGSGPTGAVSLDSAVAVWRSVDGCGPTPVITFEPDSSTSPRVRSEAFGGCAPGSRLRLEVLEGLGHEWPRPTLNPSGIDASRIIMDFFTGNR
ncbi:MAG: alpha/beta hydrolase family esterase [Gemmatimonadota bacterium]